MQQYIGTKIIKAKPMDEKEYILFVKQQWTDGQKNRPGYLVEYEDGYTSWSPAEPFEKAYRQTKCMNFGFALEAMRKGKRVTRTGWNGKNMFIYLVHGSTVPVEALRGACADAVRTAGSSDGDKQRIGSHIDMRAADGSIVIGWLASQSDMLADDWKLVE